MDSVTDIFKYHFLCFVTITQVKVISGHQGKKVRRKKSGFRAVNRCMFLGQLFTKNAKNEPKTLFEASKSVKNKIRKITVKSRNEVKSVCFLHVLCHILAIFFEDIDWKFCTLFHQPLPSNILNVFFRKF